MNFKERFFRNLVKSLPGFFNKLGLNAAFLTIFRIAFGLLTAFILSLGLYYYAILFLFIYQFVLLLDYVDGNLARLQKNFSKGWLYFDRIFHYVLTLALLTGIAISTHSKILILLALISTGLFLVTGISSIKPKQNIRKSYNLADLIIIEAPFSLFFFLVLFNITKIAVILYSTFYLLGVIYKIKK